MRVDQEQYSEHSNSKIIQRLADWWALTHVPDSLDLLEVIYMGSSFSSQLQDRVTRFTIT